LFWYLCNYDYQLIQETQKYKKVERMMEEMRS
jgi:hypothetical protein